MSPRQTQWARISDVAQVTATSRTGQRSANLVFPWTADEPGEQTIEVRFQAPMSITRIRLVFSDRQQARTQEFTVWASIHRGERHREVVRQQFNFSPAGATEQIEEYALDLTGVEAIQIRLVPSIDGRAVRASVDELCLACD